MRLFTALDLPPDTLLQVEGLMAELRPEADIKWSPRDNLHITTKFIGEWPDARLDELDAALQRVRSLEEIDIELQHFDWFPHADSPRALLAVVHGGNALYRLAAQTDEALIQLGIPKECYEYSPHLTLARIKNVIPLRGLRAKLEEFRSTLMGTFRASQFYLYRSDPGPAFSTYSKLRTYQIQP